MTTTLPVRIDAQTERRLEALAKRSRRSKSILAAEAIAAYVETESWQLDETAAGLDDLDAGRTVEHDAVAGWLRSWGGPHERQAPDRYDHRGLRRTATMAGDAVAPQRPARTESAMTDPKHPNRGDYAIHQMLVDNPRRFLAFVPVDEG